MRTLYHFLFGTLRGRLIVSVAAVHAVMMALFIGDLTLRQRAMLLDRQIEEATALSHALATSSAGWIAAADLAGLQELVDAQNRYPEMLFVILADEEGRVLADLDSSRRGQYLLDLPRDASQTVFSRNPALVDVATPARLAGRHVGWARVGIGQKAAGEKLAQITKSGGVYALAAILIGSVIAWLMGRRITRRLYAVQETIDAVRCGNRLARSSLAGADEAAVMAREFNAMLDALAELDRELTDSEQRWRSLLQTVKIGVVIHDRETRIVASNTTAQAVLGLTEQQMLGKTADDPAWQFVKEAGAPMPPDSYPVNQVISTGRPVRGLVLGVRRPDRQEVTWMLVNADPVHDADGTLREVIVGFMDVTERKRVEVALQHSEERYRQIVETAEEGIWLVDREWKTFFVNARMAQMLGWQPCEMLGRHLCEFTDDRGQQHALDLMTRRDRGIRETHDFRFIRRDGTELWALVSANAIVDQSGEPVSFLAMVTDITERRRAEEALRTSENRYRMAQAMGHVGNWEYNLQTTQFWGSDEAKCIYGFDTQQASFTTNEVENCIPERERVHQALVDLIETGKAYNLEFDILPRNSSEPKTIASVAELRRDEHGNPLTVMGVVQDITERKRAEENLRESERKLRAIFDHTFQFIGLMTPDGILIEANRGALELVGARRSEVLGKPFWRAPWWAHSTEIQEKVHDSVKAASGGQFIRFETTHRAHDGRSVCVDYSLTPVSDDQGHVVLLIPEGRDITERKLAEEADRRLALIVESTDDAIIAKTLDGTILTWNGGAERLYGYSAQEIVGKSISILVPTDFSDELPQILARIRRRKRISHYETTRVGKDGRRIEVSLCISPLTNGQGAIVGASTIARDITERKRAEASLRESQRRQAESERLAAIGRVAARVAHEINNPLAGIRNSFRLVRDAVAADHPDRDMVERMEREIDRISHIVQQMYLLYRHEAARIGDIVVAQVIEDVLAMLEPLRRERGVVLSAGAAPPDLTVRLAEGILQQILYNLVANAIEASPEGGAIAVSAAPAAKHAQNLLEITVRDGGQGIPPEIQDRIFEPFFTTKSGGHPGKGLGLGLSIVRSIVEAHGGSISLESTPGRGTVFQVFLPYIPITKER